MTVMIKAALGAWVCLFSLFASRAEAQVTVDFTADATTGTNPVDVAFTSIITGTTSTNVLWNFGDGTTSAALDPTHTYTAPGSYSVTLAVFVGLTPVAKTKSDYIVVDAATFTPDFTVSATSGTNPATFEFADATTGVTPTAWVWGFGDGSSSIEQNPSHTYDTPGVYSVTLAVVFGAQAQLVTKTDLITVGPALLFADFEVSAPVGESPFFVEFSDTSTGASPDAWLWEFGDGATATTQNPSHVYTSHGSYSVTLEVRFGGQTSSVTKPAIDVLPAEFEATFITDVTSGVNPLTVTFFDTTEVGVMGADVPDAWHWTFARPDGSTISSSLQNPTETFDTPGSYDVSLDVTYAGTTMTVHAVGAFIVEPAPLFPDFTADVTEGKVPLTVQFENLTAGNPVDEWEWRFLSDVAIFSTEENPLITFDTPGDYFVSLEATIGTQLETVEKVAFIRVRPERLVVDFTSDVVLGEVPATVAFKNEIEGVEPTDVSWEFRLFDEFDDPVVLKSNELNPEVVFTVPGRYDVTLTAWYEGQMEQLVTDVYLDVAPYPSTLSLETVIASHGVSERFETSDDFIVSGNSAWVVAYDTSNVTLQQVVGADILGVSSIDSWALDGTQLILGSFDSGASGLVSIFDLETGAILGQFGPPDDAPGSLFGASVDIEGDVALVGANGCAYLLDVSVPSAPELLSKFEQQSDDSTWWFTGAALHGDRALLGSRDDAAFLFDVTDPTAPVELADVRNDVIVSNPQHFQFALNENLALVGSENTAVRVLDAHTGELRAELVHPFDLPNPEFGISVAVSDRYAIVGAAHDWLDVISGAAYLYDVDTLKLAGRVAPSDGDVYEHFGWGIQAIGDALYVGAPRYNIHALNSGKLYRFELPHNAVWTDAGGGSPVDAPRLVGNGNLDPNSTTSLTLTAAPPNAPLFLVVGQSELPVPFAGGVMVPAPDARLGGYSTDSFGTLYLPTCVPTVIPPGTSLFIQAWVRDAGASDGFLGSNAVQATVLGDAR